MQPCRPSNHAFNVFSSVKFTTFSIFFIVYSTRAKCNRGPQSQNVSSLKAAAPRVSVHLSRLAKPASSPRTHRCDRTDSDIEEIVLIPMSI